MKKSEIEETLEEIKAEASKQGMQVFPDVPVLSQLPASVIWPGDWKSFLDLALSLQVSVLYLGSEEYNLEVLVRRAVADTINEGEEERDEEESDAPSQRHVLLPGSWEWLMKRVREHTEKWDIYNGKPAIVVAYWFRDGVAHGFYLVASWYDEAVTAVQAAVADAALVSERNRAVRSAEHAARVWEYAKEMASHERFAEATNESKRRFMARELFPEAEEPSPRPMDKWGWHKIADLAALYHWWYIEPTEQVSVVQKVHELYGQGETITSISATLKVSQERVKRALKTAKAL